MKLVFIPNLHKQAFCFKQWCTSAPLRPKAALHLRYTSRAASAYKPFFYTWLRGMQHLRQHNVNVTAASGFFQDSKDYMLVYWKIPLNISLLWSSEPPDCSENKDLFLFHKLQWYFLPPSQRHFQSSVVHSSLSIDETLFTDV